MALEDFGLLTIKTPSGERGWHFEQEFQGGKMFIPAEGTAGTAERLVEMVKTFRAVNRIDLGDYEREIAGYMKRVSPMNDRFKGRVSSEQLVPVGTVSPAGQEYQKPIQRISDWLYEIAFKEPRLTGLEEVSKRCESCEKCPQNTKWKTKCGPCVGEVEDRGRAIRARSSHDRADQLGACRLHGVYLPTAVFLDRDFLPSRSTDAPAFCFMP